MKYYAWAQNDGGAFLDVVLPASEKRHSQRAFEDAARTQLGSGWQVHIMHVDVEGADPTEIKTFRIR